jgi:histidinol-phosphate aminotransferase
MSIINNIKNIPREDRVDDRSFNFVRADRNEKVDDWEKKIIKKILTSISPREFTAYFNPKTIKSILSKYSKYLGLNLNNICVFNGGDAVIREFILFNYTKNLKVGINDCNYQMYNVYFKLLNIKTYKVNYIFSKNHLNLFKFNKKKFNNLLQKVDIFFLTFPNQISSEDFTVSEFDKILKKYKNKTFFIDESYHGFGHQSLLPLIKKNKNIFILRSITKTFGLAPHRVGFLIGNKNSLKKYINFQTPYPLSIFSGKLLNFFMDNQGLIEKYQIEIVNSRDLVVNKLREKGYLINNPKGNFINILLTEKEKSKILKKLQKEKFAVKISKFSKKFFVRITFGKYKTMKKIFNIFNEKNNS